MHVFGTKMQQRNQAGFAIASISGAEIVEVLDGPEPRRQFVRTGLAQHRGNQPEKFRLQRLVIQRQNARAERFVGLARESAAVSDERYPRRTQLRVKGIELGGC